MGDLKQFLDAGDSGAIALAREQGVEAVEAIRPYLEKDDSEQRFLAIECLVAAGGAAAPGLLLGRVLDGEREVRLEAANALLELLPLGKEHELAQAFDASSDPLVRQRLALVLGKLGTAKAKAKLAKRMEDCDRVYDGLVAAGARSGEPRSRQRLSNLIAEARGERVREVLTLWNYAGEPDVYLYQLRPLLDRLEPALEVATHTSSFDRRGCDLAIDLVLEHQPKNTFIFGPKPGFHYPPHEVDLVREFLDSIQPGINPD